MENIKCEICGKNSKYRCPNCKMYTCSLPCIKEHKKQKKCTGKKRFTNFVPLSEMNNDTLQNDLKLLTRITDSLSSYKRQKMSIKIKNSSNSIISHRLKTLVKGCIDRDINLNISPKEFIRYKSNSSIYVNTIDTIFWNIELQIQTKDTITWSSEKTAISEKTIFISLIDQFLLQKPPCIQIYSQNDSKKILNTPLFSTNKRYRTTYPIVTELWYTWRSSVIDIDDLESIDEDSINSFPLQILLPILPSPANEPAYIRINPQDTIKNSLKGCTIYDYPKFIIVPIIFIHNSICDTVLKTDSMTYTIVSKKEIFTPDRNIVTNSTMEENNI